MIRYSLKCAQGHEFDSWFRDSAAYDVLEGAGQISCSVCGDTDVKKSIMAPSVNASKKKLPAPTNGAEPSDGAPDAAAPDNAGMSEAPLSLPASPAEAALKELQKQIREKSDYVGNDFADEARRIHDGEADNRSIWGEATLQEAKSLHDEGIPVAPLPWMRRQNN